MAKKSSSAKVLTARQSRRQQQRATAGNPPKANSPVDPVAAVERMDPPPEYLGPSVLVPVYCTMIVLACMLLHISGLATKKGNELTWPQPLFTAVNAATLTGFQQVHKNPEDYNPFGQSLVYLLTLTGMFFSFVTGGVAVLRIARMRFRDLDVIAWALGSIVVVSVVGGVALLGENRTFSQNVFQAISAYGNSGLTIGRLPAAGSARTFLILLPLVILGGLGLPVLMEVSDWLRDRRPLSRHSRCVLTWTAGVYLCFAVILFLLQFVPPFMESHSMSGLRGSFIGATIQSINSRSAGFSLQSISSLPSAVTFVLVLAMVIGASPAGTGGGIKVTTLSVLTTGMRDSLAGQAPGRRFGAALLWLGVYLGLLAISTIALLITDPEIHLDRTLFLAASALGNVGLSHNPIDASASGQYVLCAAMLVGRVAPVLMLWYLIDTTPDAVVATG